MAKIMARINSNNLVVNTESWPTDTVDTVKLKSVGDRPVCIGDEWREDGFYRNGNKILSLLEQLEKELADTTAALKVMGVSKD